MDARMLQKSMIFKGMSEEDINAAIGPLAVYEKSYSKGDVIFNAGITTEYMGLVTVGSVMIANNDIWGNRTVLSIVGKGNFFAETYALLNEETMMVDVVANEDCRIMFMRIGNIRKLILRKEPWVLKLVTNILSITAQKNLLLSSRNFHISHKSIRARVMAYLNSVYIRKERRDFKIPFDRQQMADYLNVDRTALSKELGKMKKDGLIEYKKNHFLLKYSEHGGI